MEKYSELLDPSIKKAKPFSSKVSLDPPGYESNADSVTKKGTPKYVSRQDEKEVEELKAKKAWETAIAPASSIPMNLFMSYMSGNSLQVIPVMMSIMMVWNPLKSIFTETNKIFDHLKTKNQNVPMVLYKAVYVLCQIASMTIGIWKFYKMGLIPTKETDWLAWKNYITYKETSILL